MIGRVRTSWGAHERRPEITEDTAFPKRTSNVEVKIQELGILNLNTLM